eukprot:SAG11_NODE_5409_length_1569_cov_40.729932_1_plen_236_part_10
MQQISAAVCDSSVGIRTHRNTEESHTAVRSISGRCSRYPRPYVIPRWHTKHRGITYGRAQRLRAVQQISAAVCDSSVVYETPRNHIHPRTTTSRSAPIFLPPLFFCLLSLSPTSSSILLPPLSFTTLYSSASSIFLPPLFFCLFYLSPPSILLPPLSSAPLYSSASSNLSPPSILLPLSSLYYFASLCLVLPSAAAPSHPRRGRLSTDALSTCAFSSPVPARPPVVCGCAPPPPVP